MIKVYSSPTCPWCIKAKDYLKLKGVEYTDVNVTVDKDGAMEMIKLSGQQGVPVLNFDGKIIIGFDKNSIDKEIIKNS